MSPLIKSVYVSRERTDHQFNVLVLPDQLYDVMVRELTRLSRILLVVNFYFLRQSLLYICLFVTLDLYLYIVTGQVFYIRTPLRF